MPEPRGDRPQVVVDDHRLGLRRERERRRDGAPDARRDRDRLRGRLRRADALDDREHRRERVHQRVLGVAGEDAAARAEQPQRRRVPAARDRRRASSSSGRALASPTRFIALTRSRSTRSSTCVHVDVRLGRTARPCRRRAACRAPTTGRSRASADRARARRTARARARRPEERAQPLRGVVDDRRRDRRPASVIGGPPGFPPPSAPKKMSSWRHTTPFGMPVVPPV